MKFHESWIRAYSLRKKLNFFVMWQNLFQDLVLAFRTLKVLQIAHEKKKSLKIQIWDTMQHINWYLQFEWYQILQYSAFTIIKIVYPKIPGQHITQTPAIMGLQVNFQNLIFLFFWLNSCRYQKMYLLTLFNKKQN